MCYIVIIFGDWQHREDMNVRDMVFSSAPK